jgi:Flp pilus assembly protein TadG
MQRTADPVARSPAKYPAGANRIQKMVNGRLIERVTLLRFAETLQQSLSCNPRLAADCCRSWGSLMPSPAASTAAVRNALRRFRRNRRGSTAVEFALVAPVFFALLFAIIETAMVFFAAQVLETVTQDSGRTIMTGQVQTAALTKDQFKTAVCARISVLFDCTNGIFVDVQNYPAFANVAITDPISGGCFVPPNNYNPGGPGDIVVVRLFYQWPLFVTGLGYNIANLCGSKRLLSGTAVFRNEPY